MQRPAYRQPPFPSVASIRMSWTSFPRGSLEVSALSPFFLLPLFFFPFSRLHRSPFSAFFFCDLRRGTTRTNSKGGHGELVRACWCVCVRSRLVLSAGIAARSVRNGGASRKGLPPDVVALPSVCFRFTPNTPWGFLLFPFLRLKGYVRKLDVADANDNTWTGHSPG